MLVPHVEYPNRMGRKQLPWMVESADEQETRLSFVDALARKIPSRESWFGHSHRDCILVAGYASPSRRETYRMRDPEWA